jgi:hypothetical protein
VAEATVVWCDYALTMSEFAAVVASISQMGPNIRPGIGVVDDLAVCMHIEGGLLDASLSFHFQPFDPHGFFELLN